MGQTKKEILTRLKDIEAKLDLITSKLESILTRDDKESIGGIELAMQITGLAKPTLYSLISARKIPYKKEKRLYFKRKELENWIESGRRKTVLEIRQSVK